MKQQSLLTLMTYLLLHSLTGWYSCIAGAPNLPLKFSGFIQHDIFWDSRQVIAAQEGLGLYFPAPRVTDACCNDINAQGQFNMLPIYSRLGMGAKGPTLCNAQTRGYIEADFLGKPGIVNVLRLRHAYLDLIWKHLALRAGQYWHPMVVPEALPDVIDINTGFPINQITRNPQILLRYAHHHHEIKVAAITQLDFTSPGPRGNSSTYLRNAIVPNLYAEVKGLWNNHFAGIGIDYKRLRPRLESMVSTSPSYAVHETVNSVSGIIFGAVQYPTWHLYSKCTYGQNLDDANMINGYGVSCINPITGAQKYTPIRALSWWIDASVKYHDCIEPGIYTGFSKNIGSVDTLATDASGDHIVYGRAPTLDHVAVISPRVYWHRNALKVGAEVVYSHAAYGTITDQGTISNPVPVTDVRVHIAIYYFF